jgi:hypothetical protein
MIISKSRLTQPIRDILLTAKYFSTKPTSATDLSSYSNSFVWNSPVSLIEKSIITMLDNEKYNYKNKLIEYWFQHQIKSQGLEPHCDYNHIIRKESLTQDGSWLHTCKKTDIMSPVTISCYLQTSMSGGELCISDQTWFDYATPLSVNSNIIKSFPYKMYSPEVDDIFYFNGSKYFHWINPVLEGERKSMQINFWDNDSLKPT